MVDVMFVDGNSFIIASARKIQFVTVEHVTNFTAKQLRNTLNKVIKLYG